MTKLLAISFCVLLLISSMFGSVAMAEEAYEVAWSRQLGTSDWDFSFSVAVDANGNTFISGFTKGNLGGTYAGSGDAFLTKYDPEGNLLWTRQFGTSAHDNSRSVAVDATGNAIISGFITIYDFNKSPAGNGDAFLAKYDPAGKLLWSKQLGTKADDMSSSVAVDAIGNIFISGSTYGNLGGANAGSYDAFFAKYSPSGKLLWTRQFGTSDYDCSSITVDATGNILITGWTAGSLGGPNAGGIDAFLAKFDSEGKLLWTKQLGTSAHDLSHSVAVDSSGNAFISGDTEGSLGGPNVGSFDAFLVKLSAHK